MKTFSKCRAVVVSTVAIATISVVLSLSACGGGGSSGDGTGNPNAGAPQTVSGTVAKGAALPGAAVNMTCANGALLGGTSSASGEYTTAPMSIAYPCVGTAAAAGGVPTYRNILFAGNIANFSPLTDMLAEVVLAASAPASASLSMAEFIAKMSTDAVFSTNVSSLANASAYRRVVLNVIANELSATKTPAEIAAILATAATFDTTPFVVGSPLDKVLDGLAATTQNADGSVKATILAKFKASADALPLPPSKATGAVGS